MMFLLLEYIDKIYSATTIYQTYFFEKTSPMQYASAFSVNWFTEEHPTVRNLQKCNPECK